jgi:hypothetical protein
LVRAVAVEVRDVDPHLADRLVLAVVQAHIQRLKRADTAGRRRVQLHAVAVMQVGAAQ